MKLLLKKLTCILLPLIAIFHVSAQTLQQLKDSAAAFPAMPKSSSGLMSILNRPPTFGSGAPFSDIEYTILNMDYIDGENGGGDVFMPVNPSEEFPGTNTVKVIKCVLNTDLNENYQSANRDRIILGTAEHPNPFFLRGSDGIDNDYVSIIHFDYEYGVIQLKGNSNDYSLIYCDSTDNAKTTGWYLFYTAHNNIDLIAFIFPCDVIEPGVSGNPPQNLNPLCDNTKTLDLNNPNHFQFATPISKVVSIPNAIAQIGTTGKDIITGIAVDSVNNSYLLGYTDGDINGINDTKNQVFVKKVDSMGKAKWTYSLNITQGSLLFDAVVDDTHLFVCGRTLGNLLGFKNAGRWDGFILKIDKQTGQLVNSNQWGNQGIDGYGNIEFDDDGNLFVSGQGSLAGVSGTDNVYLVAKHHKSDLSNIWRTLMPTSATGFSASAEAWGGLTYHPSSIPGQGKLIAAGWYMAGGANAFLSVYENLHLASPTRSHSIIINSSGGTRADWILDNVVDNQGNIYVAGYTTGNLQGTHLGEGDAFIIKYSPQLTNPIIKQFGTNKSDMVRKLAIDKDNNIYATGYTYGNYDGNINGDPTLRTADVFVQKFDQNLNFLGSKQFGSPHEERGYCFLKDSILFVGGITEGSIKTANLSSFDGFVLALNTSDLSYNSNPVLSIINSNFEEQMKFYPNPTNDLIRFEIDGSKNYDFSISNQLGQQLKTGKLNTIENTISLSEFKNGVYFINLTDKHSNRTIKIIKR